MANYHVTKNNELNMWRVKKEGAERVSEYCKTQAEAEKTAKMYSANNGGGEVVIHKPNGVIRDSDTVYPGNDPPSVKDKKF